MLTLLTMPHTSPQHPLPKAFPITYSINLGNLLAECHLFLGSFHILGAMHLQTKGRQGLGKACPAFCCRSVPTYPTPCPVWELTFQDGDVDVRPDLGQDIAGSRSIDRVSRGQWVLRVTTSLTVFGEMGGHRLPKGRLLCGDPKHKRKKEYCPDGPQAGCPHDDLEGETDTFVSAYLVCQGPGIAL